MKKIESVALIGLGAMGVFFAPKLERALGNNFRVIAGGERKKRLMAKGVTINGVNYKFNIVEPGERTDPADLVIIAVKGYGLDEAIEDIREQVGEDTLILSVLNGVDSEERVMAVYGSERVLYSYMRVSIVMDGGIADFDPELGVIHFGEEKNETLSERVKVINGLFDNAGISYINDRDMRHGLWYKFMCNVGENLTCALLGEPFAAFQLGEHANFIRKKAMREVIAVAGGEGVVIGEDDVKRQEETIPKLPPKNKPSTLQDLERGGRTETDMFAGTVMRLGEKHGIATPVCELLYHSVLALEDKNARLNQAQT